MLLLVLLVGVILSRALCVRPSSLRPVLEAVLQVPLPEQRLDFDTRLHTGRSLLD